MSSLLSADCKTKRRGRIKRSDQPNKETQGLVGSADQQMMKRPLMVLWNKEEECSTPQKKKKKKKFFLF